MCIPSAQDPYFFPSRPLLKHLSSEDFRMLSLCLQRREEILFFLMSPLLPRPLTSDLMSLHSCFTESLNFPFRIIYHSILKRLSDQLIHTGYSLLPVNEIQECELRSLQCAMCSVISAPHSPHALSSYMQWEDRASLNPVETHTTVFCQQLK